MYAMSDHSTTVPPPLSDHLRSSHTPTPPHATRSTEWDDAAMVLVSICSASAACSFLFDMILDTSPKMLRRLWTKKWPSIVITLGISWAYAITALYIKPHYVHGLWLLFFRVMVPTYLYAVDAVAVYYHLRLHPKPFELFVGSEDNRGKKKNSLLSKFAFSVLFLLVAIDIARHYLIVELSKDVNLVTLNITNPFNNRPVTFNNVDLATAFFWGATIFMAQSIWTSIDQRAFQETVADMTHYELVLETHNVSGEDGNYLHRLAAVAFGPGMMVTLAALVVAFAVSIAALAAL